MRVGILLAIILCNSAAHAQSASLWTEQTSEWRRGWCDAVKAVIGNRDRYRAMMHFPAETLDESMKRIYEKWPPQPPLGFKEDTVVDQATTLYMAGVDLYIILPPQPCEGK